MTRAVLIVSRATLFLTDFSTETIKATITATIYTSSLSIAELITAYTRIAGITLTLPVSIGVAFGGTIHTGKLAAISHVGMGTVQAAGVSPLRWDITAGWNPITVGSPWAVRCVTGRSRPVQITGTLLRGHVTGAVSHAILRPARTLWLLTFVSLVSLVIITLTSASAVTPAFVGALHGTAQPCDTLQLTHTQTLSIVCAIDTWDLAVVPYPMGATFTSTSRGAVSMIWAFK